MVADSLTEIFLKIVKKSFFSLAKLSKEWHYTLAYSGGMDSQVLLHVLYLLRQSGYINHLSAIHINHGLSSNAAYWQKHCQHTCTHWQIPLKLFQITMPTVTGLSTEAVARELRYTQLASCVTSHTCLITAHHQTDQAETLLLQLLRGCSVAGLAAMPIVQAFSKGILLRPLLTITREEIEHYIKHHALNYVDDESNQNLKFDRNFLRHEIFPVLQKRWPKVHAAFALSTHYCAQALQLQDELAAIDLATCCKNKENNCLKIFPLKQLSDLRQNNVIRYFLKQKKLTMPSRKKLNTLIQQMKNAKCDRQPEINFANISVRRYRDEIYFLRKNLSTENNQQLINYEIEWNTAIPLVLPQQIGILQAKLSLIDNSPTKTKFLLVRFRRGGERMHPFSRCGSRSLKKLMQEWGIPPWLRGRIPLIFYHNTLCIVPGYARTELTNQLGLPEIVVSDDLVK